MAMATTITAISEDAAKKTVLQNKFILFISAVIGTLIFLFFFDGGGGGGGSGVVVCHEVVREGLWGRGENICQKYFPVGGQMTAISIFYLLYLTFR